jgi:transcription elongation GreA/GreB family factor
MAEGNPNYITRAGARRLQEELVELRTKQRPKVVQDVADAAAQGDRSENAEYIFTVGNARPLDQALQHATTEMQRWLIDDYGLDSTSAGILLGQCVEYDLGNIFDPAYTMVCKLRKRLLPARV